MNVADSEIARSRLERAGFEITSNSANADVLIYNTCSVRAKAEQKVFTRIENRPATQRLRRQIIGILGCVAQLEGEKLFNTVPELNIIAGTRAATRLPALIQRVLDGENRLSDLEGRQGEENWNILPRERNSPYIAFVPVIEGCNKFCTYCIVPYSRGREISRPVLDILGEINKLRLAGVKEVHLIGQNVNSYRPVNKVDSGLQVGKNQFASLLRSVASTGLARIKYTTSFPRDFHADIVAAMDENENLCDWIHLPVQSGSNRVLRAMRRGYKCSDYLAKVDVIRSAKRRYSLTSDIIIGFPGETVEDFEQTLQLVQRCKFDGLYIFKYSARPGTPSFNLKDDVSEAEKAERFQALQRLQNDIQREVFNQYIGQIVSVLVEGMSTKSKLDLTGHTTCHKVVNFPGNPDYIGKIVAVMVTEAKAHSLYGNIVQ
jgi:tRNA-2-methylthio-N6-dimethylallyladenosine synthase